MIAPCGMECTQTECEYYPNDCPGCFEVEGKTFWTQFTGESVCDIYDCCVNEKKHKHCGQCKELPCERFYGTEDPNYTHEEHEADTARRVEKLRNQPDAIK